MTRPEPFGRNHRDVVADKVTMQVTKHERADVLSFEQLAALHERDSHLEFDPATRRVDWLATFENNLYALRLGKAAQSLYSFVAGRAPKTPEAVSAGAVAALESRIALDAAGDRGSRALDAIKNSDDGKTLLALQGETYRRPELAQVALTPFGGRGVATLHLTDGGFYWNVPPQGRGTPETFLLMKHMNATVDPEQVASAIKRTISI